MTSATFLLPNTGASGFALAHFVTNTRRLLPFVVASMLLHLLWVWVLPPINSTSETATKRLMTIVKIAPREIATTEMPPTVETPAIPRHGSHDVTAPVPISSSASAIRTQTTESNNVAIPPINVGVLVREAGVIARETPATNARPNSLNLAVSPMNSAVAGALRNEVWVESRTSEGWVMKNGKTTCIIAPQFVPHYMQGMLIVPRCTVGN